jgi:dipeptidyl aminopeptidase/acylaminoacyl peptidase
MKKFTTIILSVITVAAVAQNKLTPETLWKLGRVSDPQLSPDGKMVLYNVRSYSLSENKGNSDIYIVPAVGGTATAIANTPDDENSARWSGDGKKVYYFCAKGGSSQLWSMDADGKNKMQVTPDKNDISNYEISPSGNMIWMTMEVKVDKSVQDIYPDLPKATGRIYDDLMYHHWTTWEDGSYSHVFVATFTNGKVGEPKDIQPGERFDTPLQPDGGGEQISWSHDGKYIAYTCKKLAGREYATSTNSDIYIYEVASGKTTNVSEGMRGYDVVPRFSPDGSKMIWLSMETPTYEADRNRIILYDLKTKTKTELTKGFDYSVSSAEWAPAGNMIYFLCGINATDQLWVYDFNAKAKNTIKQITHDVADHTGFTLAMNGKETVAVTSMMSISMPTELYNIDLKTGAVQQITYTNKSVLDPIKMGRVEKRMVGASDGKNILTWIIYPPDFNPEKKYPALLYCQGGPQSTVSQFFSYRWNFQLMAANGYIVVAPNRRGLPSFGTEWNREISGDWGGQCMNDYLAAIDQVSKETYVDKDKLGAVGASFGGYSVYWLAGHHQKRFKAFIAHCGVFNLESMFGTTEELWFPDFDLGGPYWKTPMPKSYSEFSPHSFVKNWDTPILVVHNEKDFRVPLGQGMEAYTAARLQNIPARFLCFPDEGHWVSKPQNSVLWQRVFFDWLDKYLK